MNMIELLAPVIPKGARSGRSRTGMLGVTIHNTGNYNSSAGAENHGKYLQNSGKDLQASWHYAVDDKCVVRCIPENEVSWHAGDSKGDGNYKTISIEICVNPDSNLLTATDNAAELAADILKRYGLTAEHLYQHNHWNKKECPYELRRGNPYTWETFYAKVSESLNPVVESFQNTQAATKSVDEIATEVVAGKWGNGEDRKKRLAAAGYDYSAVQNAVNARLGKTAQQTALKKVFLTVSTKLLPLWLNGGWNGSRPTTKLIKMPKGAVVELLEKSNTEWYKIKYNGMIGYAASEYLMPN